MNKRYFYFAAVLAIVSVVGCSRSIKTYTEEELNQLIVAGMSESDIVKEFGKPLSRLEINQGKVNLVYTFPHDFERQGFFMSGFSVHLSEGVVDSWSPVMTDRVPMPGSANSLLPLGRNTFQLYLATSNDSELLEEFQLEGSVSADNLSAPPDLTLSADVSISALGGGNTNEVDMKLTISEDDSSKLLNLTQTNYGKTMIVVCSNQVISAPTISEPLAAKEILFRVKSSQVLHMIRGQ